MGTNPHPYGTRLNRSVPDAGTSSSIVMTPRSPAGCTTSPCLPPLSTLGRIFVVKSSMTKLDDSIIDDACNIVKSELESLFKNGKGQLTGLFSVIRGEPDGVPPAGAKDFALYLITKSDSAKARRILERYLTNASPAGIDKAFKGVVSQLDAEGGAAATAGATQHVAFVALDLFAEEAGGVPESEQESSDRKSRVGIYLAGMMLHELAHCMGAGHDTGIMAPKEEIETSGVPALLHFSPKSKSEILRAFAPPKNSTLGSPSRK